MERKRIEGTNYDVCSNGQIWSNRTSRFLKLHSNGHYLKVTLSIKGVERQYLVHRLVAKYFIPNPDHKREVNHIDRNKFNNDISNLEWVTPKENQLHAVATGLKKFGTALWNGKFTKEQVIDIINKRKQGIPCHVLGKIYGCNQTTISAISRGLRYKKYFSNTPAHPLGTGVER